MSGEESRTRGINLHDEEALTLFRSHLALSQVHPENWNRQTVADTSSLRASSSQELTPDEMTARKKAHTRRHCLVQTMENTFELLPPDHPVYQREDVWKHSQAVHQNEYPIVMQRLHVPRLPYEWKTPQEGEGAEK